MSALSLTAAQVIPSVNATVVHGRKAAVAIIAGQIVYVLADGTLGLADSDNATVPNHTVAGMAVNSAAAGQFCSYVTADPNLQLATSALVYAGQAIFAHSTPGAITGTQADILDGWFVTGLGYGVSTTNISFSITPCGVAADVP